MDHFNSTIRDGELVNTRRGLQVSRQKFNGISFVNAYPQNSGSAAIFASKSTASPDQAKGSQREFKFVEPESTSRQSTPKSQRQDSNSPAFSGFSSETSQTKRARKRLNLRDQSSAPSPASPSRRSSRASSNTSSLGEGPDRSQTPRSQEAIPTDLTRSQTLGSTAWPSIDPPTKMSEDNWRLFHRYFATLPSKIYPFEDILAYNPATGSEFYDMHANDEVAVQIVLMCGSIATAIIDEEINPKGLAYYISIICAMLNRKLNQSKTVDDVTLLCIAALAASACYVGRLDHWHMHMRGLQRALDVKGGLSGLPAWLLNKIHLTDLEGATALACGPYLEYTRQFEPISNILAPALRNRICTSLSSLLNPLQIDPTVIGALASLSLFSASIRLAKTSSGAVAFEPHAFTDEWLAVRHSLVTQPRPLQDQIAFTPRSGLFNPFKIPGAEQGSTSNAAKTSSELYMGSHRLEPSVPIIPAELGAGGPLEPALRIACLLYLKELLPNWPRNLGGYAVLFKLLNEHMHTLYGILNGSHEIGGDSAVRASNRPGIQKKLGTGDIRGKTKTTPPTSRAHPQEPTPNIAPSLKPVLLWLCVVSDMVSRIADQNEGRRRPSESDYETNDDDDDKCYHRAIYRDIIRDILGVITEQDIDGLLANDRDLVMFSLLDPALIYRDSPLILRPEHAALVSRKGQGSFDKEGGGCGGTEDCSVWLKSEPQDNMDRPRYTPRREDIRAGEVWDLRRALIGMLSGGEGG